MNDKDRAHNERMNTANIHHVNTTNAMNYYAQNMRYNQQRSDAIKDRDYADKYNSPEQQMQRFKEAGLNPHLIYGNAANTTSASVKGANFDNPHLTPPEQKQHVPYVTQDEKLNNLSNSMQGLSDTSAKMSQTANMNANTDLVRAKEMNENQELSSKSFDLTEKQQLRDVNREIVKERLQAAKLDNTIREGEPDRRDANVDIKREQLAIGKAKLQLENMKYQLKANMTPYEKARILVQNAKDNQYIMQSKQHISESKQKILIMKIEKDIKKTEADMKKNGLNPNSNTMWDRLINISTRALINANETTTEE